MRTLAIVLLATVNLALLVSVSLPLFRHDAYVPAVAAQPDTETQDKTVAAPAARGDAAVSQTAVPSQGVVSQNTVAPRSAVSAPGVPDAKRDSADATTSFLYVKGSGLPQGARVERDSKTVADLKDVKDVEPIAELVPGGERVLTGVGSPNSEFVTSTVSSKHSSTNDPGESTESSSGKKSLGILHPAQVINTVPPTVSEESPL